MTQIKFTNKPLEKSFHNLVEELIGGLPGWVQNGNQAVSTHHKVPVNISETENGYVLEVIAPGFEKSDFQITLDDHLLTIAVEKHLEKPAMNGAAQPEKQIRKEYDYRNFKRSFTLDEKIDATGIEASYVNGVLLLNLPKKTEVRQAAKKIEIK